MAVKRQRRRCTRRRIGRVSLYHHHGAWWVYYREADKPIRRRVGSDEAAAERVAAEVNSQLSAAAPTLFTFMPLSISELRDRFLKYHQDVLGSSVATVNRYRTATQHLVDYVAGMGRDLKAQDLSAAAFVTFLRQRLVSPNGHANTKKRKLRGKGLRFVLEVCRSLFAYAAKNRHLPPYAANPFAVLQLDRMRTEDAKPIFVFTEQQAVAFLNSANEWAFPIHCLLLVTGMRPGELCHLLIEDVRLEDGWLSVCNKTELGWRIKTGRERSIPLVAELCAVFRRVISGRKVGPIFLRPRFGCLATHRQGLDRCAMGRLLEERLRQSADEASVPTSAEQHQKTADGVWRDIGAIDPDRIRTSFIRSCHRCELKQSTCPKSWRHTFATLLQDANVDPLIRQITMGHQPRGANGALGMTAVYTHTRPTTHLREIDRALRTWPTVLELAAQWAQGGAQ